jgi:hypothetical protein
LLNVKLVVHYVIGFERLNKFGSQNLKATVENIVADVASRPELMQPCCTISAVVKQTHLNITIVRYV